MALARDRLCGGSSTTCTTTPGGGPVTASPTRMGLALNRGRPAAGRAAGSPLLDTWFNLRGGLAADGSPVGAVGPRREAVLRRATGHGGREAGPVSLAWDEHGMLGAHARAGGGDPLGAGGARRTRLQPVVAWSHAFGAPLHAHLSEQPAENVACPGRLRRQPPARLLDPGGCPGTAPARWFMPPISPPGDTSGCSAAAGPWPALLPDHRGPTWPTGSDRPGRWPARGLPRLRPGQRQATR